MIVSEVLQKAVLENLPQRAGKARLSWVFKNQWPERKDGVITLPILPDIEFLQLKNGEQFLLVARGNYEGAWFGGTDENPFLTQLKQDVLKITAVIPDKGEDYFFEYLKPSRVKYLEKTIGKPAKRQGDIFAVPLFGSWQEVKILAPVYWNCDIEPQQAKGKSLFQTRHRLNGTFISTGNRGEIWATGVVEAPDHSPLILEHPHVICQVEVLYDPPRAD